MVKTLELINVLNKFAPLDTAQHWDNSGWQIDLAASEVNKVMLSLNISAEVVSQAIESGCDFILSHHPLFFDPIKKINSAAIIDAIKNNIQIYSMHTNLDVATGGTTDTLVSKLNLGDAEKFDDFVRIVKLDKPMNVNELIKKIKGSLNLNELKVVNDSKVSSIQKIALCAGSGGGLVKELNSTDIDLYITGDVKYHEVLEASDLLVFDIGHYDSEKFVVEIFRNVISTLDVEIVVANEKNIWKTV